jgi:hypothetical protein
MKMKNKCAILIVLLALVACSKKSMNPPDFCAWVSSPESGMVAEKEINGLVYTAMYRPAEYMVLQNNNLAETNPSAYTQQLAEASAGQYFVLQIKSLDNNDVIAANAASKEEYHARMIYLSYRVQESMRLVDNGDTLNCRLAQFEQIYAAAPYARLNLVFDTQNTTENETPSAQKSTNGDKTLVFDDKVWGNGLIKLKIKANDLNNIPKVRI